MQIDTEFFVQAPPKDVWDYLLRTEDVVECIPGATITEKVTDDRFAGQVTIKLGPLGVSLAGVVTIEERDHETMTMGIAGKAKDTKGRGATDATVTARVFENGGGSSSRVSLVSQVKVTGKIAQFGRGVMKDVSQRIAEEFAVNLEARLAGGVQPAGAPPAEGPDGQPAAGSAIGPGVRASDAPSRSEGAQPPQRARAVGGIGLVLGALLRAAGRGLGQLARRVRALLGR